MSALFRPMARPDLERLAPFDTELSDHDRPDALSVPWSRPAPSHPRKRWSARWISVATIIVVLAAWALTAALGIVSPVFLPSPAAVAAKFVSVATEGFVDSTLLEHLGVSLARVFAALIASVIVGVPVGIAIGMSTVGRGIFDPLLEFLRPIPPLPICRSSSSGSASVSRRRFW